jgi:non-ribosomal peptide synthetase component F
MWTPSVLLVPDLVRAQAECSPDAVAVESAGERLTYAELLARAAGLAHHLHDAGIRPGDLVAVAVPRGVDLAPALVGINLAGAAFVPLDPRHPAGRLIYILGDA